ncbi:hypothetical protein Tco_1305850 [Tanacetum coccineum]
MDYDDESIGSSVSYIILSDSETKDTVSLTAVLDYAPDFDAETESFEAPPSPDYASALDADTKPLEAPTSPDYTPGSDTNSKSSEHDLEESSI